MSVNSETMEPTNVLCYSRDDLNKLALDSFITEAKKRTRGLTVSKGDWKLQITYQGVRILKPFAVKQEDGTWLDDFTSVLL